MRYGGRVVCVGRKAHAVEPEPAEVAYDPAEIAPERERVAYKDIHDRGDAHDEEGGHQRVQHVFAPDHASVEEGEPRRHEQHERACGENPCHVAGIDTFYHLIIPPDSDFARKKAMAPEHPKMFRRHYSRPTT